MSNVTITQSITKESIARAIAQARVECAASRRWLNAVNRAALNLESCRWSFDGDTLRIESATASGTFYTVTVATCPCKAGQKDEPCWHRASCRLLVKAAEMAAPARPMADAKPTLEELQAAADELFA